MSIVTDYLRNTIQRQVTDHEYHVAVWFDPERHYAEFAAQLSLPDITMVRYTDSFLALRHEIDALIAGDTPRPLLVYVPLAEEATHHALVELTAFAAVLKPGQSTPQRNTRLAVVARRALRAVLGDEKADEIARQVEAGKLTLADLDRIGSSDGGSAVLKSLFGTSHPQEIALAFLSGDRLDAKLQARNALDDLTLMLQRAFGVPLPTSVDAPALRQVLALHVLKVEFLASMGERRPHELATIALPPDTLIQEACIDLVRTWRVRRDLQPSYVEHAEQAARALDLGQIGFSLDEIRRSETFALVESALQAAVESACGRSVTDDLLDLVQQRLSSGFWAAQNPIIQARWAIIHTAGLLVRATERIERDLRLIGADPVAMLRAYAEGEHPWCLLDTHQRHLERRWHAFEIADAPDWETLDQLATYARQRFMHVGGRLARAFAQALADAKFALPGLLRQREIFVTALRPALQQGKTAYILVDALRFEMARELFTSLDSEYAGQLVVAVGSVPSITEIGMAALMPGAQGDAAIIPTGDGKIGVQIGTTVLKDRKTRFDWFRKQVKESLVITALEEMLPKPKPDLHTELHQAEVIVVTSQEIDELAERDNIHLARKVMDDTLSDLARLIRKLREYGCKTIVIAADHGYLFGDELGSDMKVDVPGGQTIDLHRRVWVGRGGAASDSYLRAQLSQFGWNTDLEVAFPWGFAAFKVSGGARAYFHGGITLQELAIPVLTLHPMTTGPVTPLHAIEWVLTAGSKKISTRFFSVEIGARSNSLFEFDPPRIRVEIRSKGAVVAEPVSATYGLATGTGEIDLRVLAAEPQQVVLNTITFMITGTPGKTASVHLLDAATGRELARIDRIDVALLAF